MRTLRLHPLYEGDAGGGTGGNPQNPTAPASAGGDPAAAFNNLMARSSDAAALARQLFEENFRYRTELREAQRQIPAQGAVVLSAEQAQAWQAYQGLGAPDQVQQTIAAHRTLQRDLELRDVAGATGYSLDVLRTLAADLAFEVRTEQKDGKPIKAVYVKVDNKDVPLETYATEKWAAFLPALRPAQAAGSQGAPNTGATNPVGLHGQQPPTRLDPKNPPRLTQIDWKR